MSHSDGDAGNPAVVDERLKSLELKFDELEKTYNALAAQLLRQSAEKDKLNEQDKAGSTDAAKGDKDNDKGDKDKETRIQGDDASASSRIRVLSTKIDENTGEVIENERKPEKQKAESENATWAVTLRKTIYVDRERGSSSDRSKVQGESEIDIRDESLWELLKANLGSYPSHTFQSTPITIYSPFEPFVHNWDKLMDVALEVKTEEKDINSRKDLKHLLDTISSSSGDYKLDSYFKARAKKQDTVTFDNLWTIFPPGCLVYGKPFLGKHQVFLVQGSFGNWPATVGPFDPPESKNFKLACWAYDWDGKKFCRMRYTLQIPRFEGQKSIVSLPFYPFQKVEASEEGREVRDKLVERGKKFKHFCHAGQGPQMFKYSGDLIIAHKGLFMSAMNDENSSDSVHPLVRWWGLDSSQGSGAGKHSREKADGKVMVDFESYRKHASGGNRIGDVLPLKDVGGECKCEDCKQNEGLSKLYRAQYDDEKAWRKATWDDEQYLLCPPRVLGYELSGKKWAQLYVSDLEDIERDEFSTAWKDRLWLDDQVGGKPSAQKDTLEKLVKTHIAPGQSDKQELEVDDIVAHKGKGLFMLFHGPPGVGKTSTAETLALKANKPLFSISVADVGTDPEKAETNLEQIFDLATKWQAILLIDEADIFLQTRQGGAGSSFVNNALVSVFLRVLEYYHGILILTTNQIAHFDVAVHSRIHYAIKYEGLKPHQKKEICEGFFKDLDQKGAIDRESVNKYLEEYLYEPDLDLDGRQIRNIITSALGLARSEGEGVRLRRDHIVPILRNTNKFKLAFEREFDRYKNIQKDVGSRRN